MLTDTHWGARGASKYWVNHMAQFYTGTFFPTLLERGIDTIWMLGDTFDNRTNLNIYAMEKARESFFDIAESLKMKVYMILGNHDVMFRDTNEINSIEVFAKAYKNIHLIRSYETITFDGTPINFISWVNKSNLPDMTKFIQDCPPTVICGHFEISSFQMTPGQYNDHGFEPGMFDRFDRVFSGHFHTISDNGKIFYISNPFQLNWSDYSEKKGFRIFDTSTLDMEFIENPVYIYKQHLYDNECSVLDFDFEQFRNKIVRVMIDSYSTVNQQRLNLFMEKLQSVVYQADIHEINDYVANVETGHIEFEDNQQLIDKYIDEVVQDEKVDKTLLKEMFKELYSFALTVVETE